MTSAAPTPTPTPTLQGLSRAEAMSLRPIRIRRLGDALEIQVSNGQVLRMEGYYKPEVKALSESAKVKSVATLGNDTSVRGKQIRKAQELLEKAQDLADGQVLQDTTGLNEAGTMRNYWQVWQQWLGEALGLPESLAQPEPAPVSITPPPSAASDGAMSVLPSHKTPVSALEASGLGLGYVAAPVVGAVALTGGGGGTSSLTFTSPASVQVKENQRSAAKVSASNSGATFSLDPSGDATLFDLNTSSGVLSFKTAPNFEATPTKTTYTVKINASASVISGGALVAQTASQTLTIHLEDVINEDTLVMSLNSSLGSGNTQLTQAEARTSPLISVSGLTAGNTLTLVLTGTQGSVTKTISDTAAGGSVGISLSDADLSRLGEGAVSVVATSTDAHGQVSLPSNGNSAGDSALGFSIDTVAPAITSVATYSVAENTTSVGTLGVTQVNAVADSVTWALVTDTSTTALSAASVDSNLFSLVSNTGVLSFKTAPDFELPGDADHRGTYHLRVSATDTAGNVTHQDITVQLSNVVIENAPVLAFGNQINATGGLTRAEALGYTDPAGHVFGVVTATGVAAGQILLVTFDRGDGKSAQVSISGNGNPSDKLQVQLSADQLALLGDGPISVSAISQDSQGNQSVLSNVLKFTLDTAAPAFASSSVTLSVAENTVTAGTLNTSTAEAVTWSISSDNAPANADAALFSIAANGALSFSSAPDFENPSNALKSNAYRVRVMATDAAGNVATQDVTVRVTDVIEAISLSNRPTGNPYVQTGLASPLPDLQVQSVQSDGVSVGLLATGGTLDLPTSVRSSLGLVIFSDQNTSLRIYGSQSSINTALAALTYQSDPNATTHNLTYSVWPSTDISGSPSVTSTLTLQTQTLTAPVITPLQRQYRTSNLLVSSQALAQQLLDNYDLSNPLVFAALAGQYNTDSTKTKGGDLGWSLPGTFVDSYSRSMVGLSKSQVSVTPVQSQFGWHLIQLTDVRDLPGTTGDSGAGINLRTPENTPASQPLISYGAHEAVTWTLTGTDAALFAIDAQGALTFLTSPNFEVPQDAGADNTYQLNVVATSTATGMTTTRPITVTVTNVASGGALTMTGHATESQVLTASLTLPAASNGDPFWVDANNPVITTWRWQKLGADGLWADLYGGTGSTFTLPVDGSLVGAQVRVAATVTDRTGATLNLASAGQTVADNGSAPPAVSYPSAQLLSATGAQNGLLNAGDVITARVNFDKPVSVYGNPQLILYIGTGNGMATYDTANSSPATGLLSFKYTLKATDASDTDGIAIGYLDLNGATIYDTNKSILNPVVGAIDNPLFKVDNTPPSVATLSFTTSGTDPLATHATYAEANQGFIKISGVESGAKVSVTLMRSSGASLVQTFTGNFGDQTIALSAAEIAALGNGSISVSAAVTDLAGNSTSVSAPLNFTLDTLSPTILTPAVWRSLENQTAIGQLRASESVTWSLLDASGNPGASDFVTLSTSTGLLTWKQAAGLNFEDSSVAKSHILSVRATDGAGNSSTQTITVNLTDVSEAPVISASSTTVQALSASATSASTFGAGAFADVLISDPDQTATFAPTLYATLIASGGTLSGVPDADNSRVGVQFRGTPTELQTKLAALSWTDAAVGDASRSGAAAVTLIVSDVGYADTLATSSTRAVLVSRLPTLALGSGAAPSYTENATLGSPIAPALMLGHASTPTGADPSQIRVGLSRAVIDFTGGLPGDTLTLDPTFRALGFALTAQPSSATITTATPQWILTGSANANLAHWQAALRGISYSSTSEDPGASTARDIAVKVIDVWGGIAQVSQSLGVTSVADAPTLTGIKTPTSTQAVIVQQGVSNDLAVNVTNGTGVTQSVSPMVMDLDSPSVYLSITPSAQISLNPSSANQISGIAQATMAGSVLQLTGTPEGLTRALGVITFNANAAGSGQLDFRISDVSMADANSQDPQSLYIQAQTTADQTLPAVGVSATSLRTPENQTHLSAQLPSLFRPSEGVVWSFDAGGADNNKFNLNALTGEISWKTAPDFETATNTLVTSGTYSGDKAYSLSFKAMDLNGNASSPLSLSVLLQDVNEAPLRVTSVGTQGVTEHRWLSLSQLGTNYNLDLSALFKDPDAGDTLSYSANIPAGWLTLASNGRLTVDGTVPSTDTRVDFDLTATDRQGLSTTVPVSLHAVALGAPQVTGLNVKDQSGDLGVGNASQTLTLNVLLNTADLRVAGSPTATVQIGGVGYTAAYVGVNTDPVSNQGVLVFSMVVPTAVDASGVTLKSINNVSGSAITWGLSGVALDTNRVYDLSALYVVDNTAPTRPVVQLASGLSDPSGLEASALASNESGVLDVITEPGASLSVLFINANNANQRVSKTVDTALLGLNAIALSQEEVNNLGTGGINAQVISTDPAGNRSDPAWFSFNVI